MEYRVINLYDTDYLVNEKRVVVLQGNRNPSVLDMQGVAKKFNEVVALKCEVDQLREDKKLLGERLEAQAKESASVVAERDALRQAAETARAWICRVSNQYFLGADDPHEALVQLKAALTPKG